MTAATATRNPFDVLDQFGAETDEMGERFAAVATPVVAPVVHCLGCSRPLTSAASRARGYGKHCWAKAHHRAATLGPEFSDRQVEAVVDAIEEGAVVPAGIAGFFHVVSSKGDKTYEASAESCTCTAFAETGGRRMCWHRGAAIAAGA